MFILHVILDIFAFFVMWHLVKLAFQWIAEAFKEASPARRREKREQMENHYKKEVKDKIKLKAPVPAGYILVPADDLKKELESATSSEKK